MVSNAWVFLHLYVALSLALFEGENQEQKMDSSSKYLSVEDSSERTVRRDLSEIQKLGLIQLEGFGRGAKWRLLEKTT